MNPLREPRKLNFNTVVGLIIPDIFSSFHHFHPTTVLVGPLPEKFRDPEGEVPLRYQIMTACVACRHRSFVMLINTAF
jgi:hypothetical protein